jgi:predicted amidohydrolase
VSSERKKLRCKPFQGNIAQAERLIEGAAKKGADMIFLPEAFDFIGENAAETLALSQSLSGSTVARFQELARRHNVWLSLGGFHRKARGETN